MKIKCEYCGSYLNDYDEKCKNCGAINKNLNREHKGVPKTIEELKSWFKTISLAPEEKQRIAIGKNISFPKTIGIYKDEKTKKVITYRVDEYSTKDITYEGDDEEYAVNQIYNEIRDKMMKQKNDETRVFNAVAGTFESFQKVHSFMTIFVMSFIVIVFLVMMFMITRMFKFF